MKFDELMYDEYIGGSLAQMPDIHEIRSSSSQNRKRQIQNASVMLNSKLHKGPNFLPKSQAG